MIRDVNLRITETRDADARYKTCAIAFLDIVGFSKLMSSDELTTFDQWETLRFGLVMPLLEAHGGTFVKSTGDGVLATFATAAAALAWATALQREARARGEGLRMRIALNFGAVIHDAEGDIYGDSVNVAARLEHHARPGGIVITRELRDRLSDTSDLQLAPAGTLRLKNIEKPVEAWYLTVDARSFADQVTRSGQRLPSIAVLPFSSDMEDPYFLNGVVDDLIASLGGVQELDVIAQSSVRALGAHAELGPSDIGEALGVDYLVCGSLQRSPGHLRTEVELIETRTGMVVTTERSRFAADALFHVQDQLIEKIVAMIAPEVKRDTLRRALRRPPGNFTAYEQMLRALDKVSSLNRTDFEAARTYLEAAIAADPGFANPHAWLARWYTIRVGQGWSEDPAADSAAALASAQRAIRLDRRNALALASFGHVTAYTARDYDTAIDYLDRAVAAGPNNPIAHTLRSVTLSFLGRGEEARQEAEKALRLSPFDEQLFQFFSFLALACYVNGTYDEAERWGRRSLAENPNYSNTIKVLVVATSAAGDLDAARLHAEHLMRVEPDFRLSRYRKGRPPFAEDWRTDALIEHFRAAGIAD
ncbi:adenylate/guanylate cyclase domain-containing protein [Albibacillus kandeliae]|uniref:adenylate/guanylate cyclase domain-containing protein n=1 Tax=Albibacillus kandeliae TaxID=2174228 RepID=UPI001300221A|nr:adenylate/guanylate cyclase domain-containing protein [Albibacillus kandeliae]